MGMYTLFHASFSLKPDAPEEVKNALFAMALLEAPGPAIPQIDHPFFKCERVLSLFQCSSAYFSEPPYCKVKISYRDDYEAASVVVRVQSSLKNYDNEIEKFVDWITPYIDPKSGPVIYSRYEETSWNRVHVPSFVVVR